MIGILFPICLGFLALIARSILLRLMLLIAGFAIFGATCLYYYYQKIILKTEKISHFFGGFLPPFGIEYNISEHGTIMLILLGFGGLLWFAFFVNYHKLNNPLYLKQATFGLINLCASAAVCISGDLFNIYIFSEIAAISTYIFIAISANKNTPQPYVLAFEYLIIGCLSSALILLGIGFLYALTGSLNINDIGYLILDRISTTKDRILTFFSFIFIISGLLLKTGIYGEWFTRLYSRLPLVNFTLMTLSASKVTAFIFYVLIYKIYFIFLLRYPFIARLLMYVIGISILWQTRNIFKETKIQKILAISSYINLGYVIIAFLTLNSEGVMAGLGLMVSDSFIKLGICLCLIRLINSQDSSKIYINNLTNKFKEKPLESLILTVLLLALSGVPLFMVFLGKLHLGLGLLYSDNMIVLMTLLVPFATPFWYCGRLIFKIFTDYGPTTHESKDYPAQLILICVLICVLALPFLPL